MNMVIKNMKNLVRIINWPIVAYAMAILILSVAPTNSIKQVDLGSTWVLSIRSDYLLHVLLFLPWMVLVSWRWREKRGAVFFVKALTAGLFLAVISEGVQYWLPYRQFNLVDLGANGVGLAIGALIAGLGRAKRLARQKTL
jgi:glycopeptide antibiotics resistance protein